jgi:polyisoprenoid-binding protein YceI
MKKLLFLTLAAGLSAPTLAADRYTIDPRHTYQTLEYNHLGYSTQRIRFERTSGAVELDRESKSGSVDITIDANSLSSGLEEFNEHLRGGDFFDVKRFPAITFKSSRLRFGDNGLSKIDGDLTIKGISRPMTLTLSSFHCALHPIKLKTACGANATTTVKRSDFDLGKYAPMVSDEVEIHIAVEAFKD